MLIIRVTRLGRIGCSARKNVYPPRLRVPSASG